MSGTRKRPRRTRSSTNGPEEQSRSPSRRRGAASRARPVPGAGPAAPIERADGPGGDRPGELPGGYGDDALVALPRDPRSLFLYWDHAPETLRSAFEGLDHPRVQLWLLSGGGAAGERVRVAEVALESRGHYLHDLEPGRTYRAELHAVDRAGRERRLGPSSGDVALPPLGPSPVIDDRFVRLPWDRPLGAPLGAGHPRPGFPDEDREALARLSGRGRAGLAHCGSPGLLGRPSSPTSGGEGER